MHDNVLRPYVGQPLDFNGFPRRVGMESWMAAGQKDTTTLNRLNKRDLRFFVDALVSWKLREQRGYLEDRDVDTRAGAS